MYRYPGELHKYSKTFWAQFTLLTEHFETKEFFNNQFYIIIANEKLDAIYKHASKLVGVSKNIYDIKIYDSYFRDTREDRKHQ